MVFKPGDLLASMGLPLFFRGRFELLVSGRVSVFFVTRKTLETNLDTHGWIGNWELLHTWKGLICWDVMIKLHLISLGVLAVLWAFLRLLCCAACCFWWWLWIHLGLSHNYLGTIKECIILASLPNMPTRFHTEDIIFWGAKRLISCAR